MFAVIFFSGNLFLLIALEKSQKSQKLEPTTCQKVPLSLLPYLIQSRARTTQLQTHNLRTTLYS